MESKSASGCVYHHSNEDVDGAHYENNNGNNNDKDNEQPSIRQLTMNSNKLCWESGCSYVVHCRQRIP